VYISKIKTILDLGLKETLIVILYRVLIKFSIHPVCFISSPTPLSPFYKYSKLTSSKLSTNSQWNTTGNLFSYFNAKLNDRPPEWLKNPIDLKRPSTKLDQWWKISDFDTSVGDIKLIWEQSRMNWVIAFAQRASNGDNYSLDRLNIWLSDWLEKNPPYLGPNWKCGQEASVRVIHLCTGALILGQEDQALIGMQDLIKMHLQRIAPTIHYAIAQNNNHGTSEAAALFIGGSFLTSHGDSDGVKYEKLGRRWLNNRTSKLIEKDGSFSQYSLNYHRLLLDTLSIAEIWRERMGRKKFSPSFYDKASLASSWLYQMACPVSGHVPNLGANDGSLILQLTDSSYKDFRPTVQLAVNLFNGNRAYLKPGLWDTHLAWLGVKNKTTSPEKYTNCNYDYGGYKILRLSDAKVIFRYPRFKYRPSQSDAMHVDLWVNFKNILSDAGTYSYNSVPDMSHYFSGSSSHNTIQFDDRNQMPKFGRFLFGSWLQVNQVSNIKISNDKVSCFASYIDFKRAEHSRNIELTQQSLKVYDFVQGFKDKAVIRWRLNKDSWNIKNIKNQVQVSNGKSILIVKSNINIARAEIVNGWESHYYMKKNSVSVLEVEINNHGSFTSEFYW
jgi:hypothetical protein